MFKAKKSLGQNFLKDGKVSDLMVSLLKIDQNEDILEIGPGLGALTGKILTGLPESSFLTAIEFDPRAVDVLSRKYVSHKNFQLVYKSVLDFLPAYTTQKPLKVIGSLPYYITSPILHMFVKVVPQPQVGVFLVQKEVGKKISEVAPDSSYFSVFMQTFYDVKYEETVDRTKFDPVPGVDSAVISLTKRDNILIPTDNIEKYEGFLHRGFSNPRKMLNKVFTPEEFEKIKFKPTDRAQNYNWEEWAQAFRLLV